MLDVFPTLLGLLGLEREIGEGRDLLRNGSEPSGLLLSTFKGSKPPRVAVVAKNVPEPLQFILRKAAVNLPGEQLFEFS